MPSGQGKITEKIWRSGPFIFLFSFHASKDEQERRWGQSLPKWKWVFVWGYFESTLNLAGLSCNQDSALWTSLFLLLVLHFVYWTIPFLPACVLVLVEVNCAPCTWIFHTIWDLIWSMKFYYYMRCSFLALTGLPPSHYFGDRSYMKGINIENEQNEKFIVPST